MFGATYNGLIWLPLYAKRVAYLSIQYVLLCGLRFVFYKHEQQPLNPFFDEPDWKTYSKWRNVLRALAGDTLENEVHRYNFEDAVLKDWKEWYVAIKTLLVENPGDIESKWVSEWQHTR